MSVLAQKNILIGVSGGIAAYKIPLLIRQLTKLDSNIKVVMTPSSKEFVTPLTLSTVSKNDVFSEFTTQKNNNPSWNNHVELAEWADINNMQDEVKRNYMRNKALIDLTEVPKDMKEEILSLWHEENEKDRSQLLNYFIKNKLRNLMECITEF